MQYLRGRHRQAACWRLNKHAEQTYSSVAKYALAAYILEPHEASQPRRDNAMFHR